MKIDKIKIAVISTPYRYYFIAMYITYIVINWHLNQVLFLLPTVLHNNLLIIIPYFIFNLTIPFLVALNINLLIIRVKELHEMKKAVHIEKEGSLTILGVFGGMLTGACPGCLVGVLPALLGFMGLSFSFSSLPLYGIEIQMISVALLVLSIHILSNEIVCRIPKRSKGGK